MLPRFPLLLIALTLPVAAARSAPPVDAEAVARKLLATTVTVRVSTPKSNLPVGDKAALTQNSYLLARENAPPDDAVLLASGVSLGRGLIVTFCDSTPTARFRVTLPDGEQADAQLSVVDEYSGLRLIEIGNRELPALELADEKPAIGMPLLTAAAMGLDKPAVSQGILGGLERSLAGTDLPPLLLCDVRSTDMSTGAAVVDRHGKLVGIVAATSTPGEPAGWTYAAPARYVARLLAVRVDQQVVVLRRQRPIAGFTLGPGGKEGSVRVERVDPGGPAQRAGVQAGDLLLEADGRKIRSAYQAVDLILKKQPGDKIDLVVEQTGQARPLDLTLGGATPAAIDPAAGQQPAAQQQQVQVGPQLNVRVASPNQIEVRRGGGQLVEELTADPARGAGRLARDEGSMLRAQLAAFERAIAELQAEVRQRDQAQAKTQETIKSLRVEIEQLRQQLEKKR